MQCVLKVKQELLEVVDEEVSAEALTQACQSRGGGAVPGTAACPEQGRAERLWPPGEVRQGRSEFPMTPLQCPLKGAMLRGVTLTPEMLLLGRNCTGVSNLTIWETDFSALWGPFWAWEAF